MNSRMLSVFNLSPIRDKIYGDNHSLYGIFIWADN